MTRKQWKKKKKNWKQPYRKSRRFDKSCRNHGSCPYCYDNRMYNTKKKIEQTTEQIRHDGI